MFFSRIISASLSLCGLLGSAAAYTNPIRNPGGVRSTFNYQPQCALTLYRAILRSRGSTATTT